MNSVERVKALCKERKVPVYKLERDLGFSNGYIGQLRKGIFPADRLAAIAGYFGVTTASLLGEDSRWHGNCYDTGGPEDNPYELRLSEAFDRLDLDGQQELACIAEGMAADKKEQPAEPNLDELSTTKRYLIDAINRLPEDQLQVLAAVIDQVMHGRGE